MYPPLNRGKLIIFLVVSFLLDNGQLTMTNPKILGCLYGMALGDALGAVTEFLSVKDIKQRFPPDGPQAPIGNPAQVTDDTQMALAVGKALMGAPRPYDAKTLPLDLSEAFIAWYHDPENNRAPGNTCMTSIERLMKWPDVVRDWPQATNMGSKGCGANMRVMPVGLLNVDVETRAGIAQLQSAITHAHPTALAATDLTAFVIADLNAGNGVDGLLARIRDYAMSQREVYHFIWLGDLWQQSVIYDSAQHFISRGWDETLRTLDWIEAALQKGDFESDPCLSTGAGWIAEEAFATALYCFLMFPEDGPAVIRRAACSSGDSDSIACIAGSFVGAYLGVGCWDAEWLSRIEYREEIEQLAAWLSLS